MVILCPDPSLYQRLQRILFVCVSVAAHLKKPTTINVRRDVHKVLLQSRRKNYITPLATSHLLGLGFGRHG